jgi:hypothetical protein
MLNTEPNSNNIECIDLIALWKNVKASLRKPEELAEGASINKIARQLSIIFDEGKPEIIFLAKGKVCNKIEELPDLELSQED